MKWSPVAGSVRHLKSGLADRPTEPMQQKVGEIDGGCGAHSGDSITCDESKPCVSVSGGRVKQFISTTPDYPFQEGAVMNPANINYNMLKAAAALQQWKAMEVMGDPND